MQIYSKKSSVLLKAKQTKKEVASAMKDDKSIEEISISLPDIQQYEMTELTVVEKVTICNGQNKLCEHPGATSSMWNLLK